MSRFICLGNSLEHCMFAYSCCTWNGARCCSDEILMKEDALYFYRGGYFLRLWFSSWLIRVAAYWNSGHSVDSGYALAMRRRKIVFVITI